jgi:hypothetical protein
VALQAVNADGNLGLGWVDVDDVGFLAVEAREEVSAQLSNGFVFARLSGEDSQKFEALVVEARIEDSPSWFKLVRVQWDLNNSARG